MVIDKGFPAGSDSKESACNVGDLGSIPGSGKSSGDGNSKPFQYSIRLKEPAVVIWLLSRIVFKI